LGLGVAGSEWAQACETSPSMGMVAAWQGSRPHGVDIEAIINRMPPPGLVARAVDPLQ